MDKVHLRPRMCYEFQKGDKALGTCENLCYMLGSKVINFQSSQRSFVPKKIIDIKDYVILPPILKGKFMQSPYNCKETLRITLYAFNFKGFPKYK